MRVPRTFVFVDLTGFTNYTANNGDDAAGKILSAFRAATRQVASERGVRVAKWLGDGAMIVAIDQADAISMALDLERHAVAECAPLTLRVGMATGHALLFEGDDYIGSAVNLAARLCDAAGPHEILLPADQVAELPAGVIATPAGAHVLRGFPEPVAVVEITGRPRTPQDSDTGEVWTRTRFVA
ncbi:MAG: adenylate/guanylate cyclase domain-containing protein [Acidimicrobiia bacterium]